MLKFSRVWQNIMQNLHPLTPLKALPNITTAHLAIKYNARGNCQTITAACTSSAQAIGEAYRQIKSGYADIMIAGGSDSMTNPNGLVAFSMLGVLSKNNEEYKTAVRPFDKRRDGFMIGEGAAVFILEELEHSRKRGANIYAEIIGYSNTNDAYRLTDEPPDARGSIEAIKSALLEARISKTEVDYINAHGTGTQMNDRNETYAIKSVFGNDAYSIPVSSTKSMIGHLVAAAGGVEFAACLMAMKNQVIPPTINYVVPDEDCDLDYVPNISREASLNIIQTNSFGFGGQNACLIIKKV
jgi:3-oxoacyl-[acyl-carrier-protein] synthase II